MPVYLKDGKVLLVDGKVATSTACCCEGGTICCLPDGVCDNSLTSDECSAAGGTIMVGVMSCIPNPCHNCDQFPTSIALTGITLPGCCVGTEFVYIDGSIDGSINSTYSLDVVTFPPYFGYGAVDFRITEQDYADTGVCFSGDHFDDGIRAPNIVVGCIVGEGWFIEAWTSTGRPIFAAHGIADPSVPVDNELTCGVAPPIWLSFPSPPEAVGQGGTVVVAF